MENKLVKNILFIFFFLNYFLDLLLYVTLNHAGEAGYYYGFYLVIVEQPYYMALLVSLPIFLVFEIASRSKRQWKITLLFFCIFAALDGLKIVFLKYHPYLPLGMLVTPSSQEIQENEQTELLERRREYRKKFEEQALPEDNIFLDDRLDSEFLIQEPLGNSPVRYGRSKREDLNRIADLKHANRLSFRTPLRYDTEYAKTNYDEILEYRTMDGRVSFFLFGGKVQNCIYDSAIREKEYVFLKGCHQKEDFYDGFWSSVLHTYCPQRPYTFRNSNECDTLR